MTRHAGLAGLLPAVLMMGCATMDGPGFGRGPEQPRTLVSADGDVGAVVAGNSAFAWELYGVMAEGTDNVVISPFSISAALGMTSAGARGETEAQLVDALYQDIPADRWHAAWGDLIGDLAGPKGRKYRLEVANRLFGQVDYPFLEDFLGVCADDWGAPLEQVDWAGDTEGSRQLVNGWVEDQTGGLIPDLIPSSAVSSDTRLVLANAVYFLADWDTQFSPYETHEAPFHTLGGSQVTVDMMELDTEDAGGDHRVTALRTDDGQTGIVRLPYKGDEVAAYLIVPEEADGLPDWEARVTAASFDEDVAPLRMDVSAGTGDWIIQMPKLELKTDNSLRAPLEQLGVVDLFTEGVCDLTGVSPMPEAADLVVTDVLHSAVLKVDEVGTEAAAATSVMIELMSARERQVISADRPFLFVVRDDLTGSILFMARVMDPTAD